MANLIKESEKKAVRYSGNGHEISQNVSHSIEHAAQSAGSSIGKSVGNAAAKATEYVHSTRNYVERNPLQSVAIAIATGAAIGSLITMFTRKK